MKIPPTIGLVICLAVLMPMIVGCSAISQKRQVPACKAMFSQIKHDWVCDAKTGLFRFQSGSYPGSSTAIIENRDCFIGLQSKHILKLFGKPSTEVKSGQWAYYLTQPCLQKDSDMGGCWTLLFTFDAEGKVTQVDIEVMYGNDG
jgi:hypothetical protein